VSAVTGDISDLIQQVDVVLRVGDVIFQVIEVAPNIDQSFDRKRLIRPRNIY